MITSTLKDMGFVACRAYNDVYMQMSTKADGTPYWQYVLIFTDDCLVIAEHPRGILMELDQNFLLKPGSIGEPKIYLGADVKKYKLESNDWVWSMSSDTYVKAQIKNVETFLAKQGKQLKTKAPTILPSGYRPELDCSKALNDEWTGYYQQYIGILRWAVELGRVDITCECSMMAAYCAAPRQGHFEAIMHMFAYLKYKPRSRMVFDHTIPPLPEEVPADWYPFYGNVKEELPPNMPEALGNPVRQITFCDSDHAGDQVNRRSRTGVLLYVNRSLITWYSKKQLSVETSSFGSEMVAMKTAVELSLGLRYKLRMMGIPVEGPVHIKGDNMSVISNASVPESVLKKKSLSIC